MSTAEQTFHVLRVSGSTGARLVNASHEGMFSPDQAAVVSVTSILRKVATSVFGYDKDSALPATQDPRVYQFLELTSGLAELKAEDYDEDFLAPTPHAYECARRFMLEAYKSLQCDLPVPHYVPDGEGGIRIRWVRDRRELRLICPAGEGQTPFLYYEEGDVYGADEQVTDSMLLERLQWLINR